MELKVLCDCGQKFKFDVEPVNGQMPFTINCPICNADATTTANTMLAEQLSSAAPATTTETAPPPIAPTGGGLRINRVAHAETTPSPIASTSDNPPPALGVNRPFAVAEAAKPPRKTSFGMGLLGGLTGALLGSIIYFLIFKFTGVHIKWLAVGVGALAGWFAELFGKGEGSKELGGITAVLVICGVIGVQYFVALGWWHEGEAERLKAAQSAYANAMIEAKVVAEMVPTGSDVEIRAYLTKQSADVGLKLSDADFQNDDIKDFRENQLPEYRSLASGQITKEQYEASHAIKITETQSEKDAEDGTFKAVFMLLLVSKSNLFALAAAAALAFKLSTNA
ncbi:MAG TPA: hypothetical protein VGO57_04860 [Verrucomicrobiae bacterium]|jgi:hypothetical protein